MEISDRDGIQQLIICEYYKQLFGKQPENKVKLGMDAWSREGRLTEEDNAEITRAFSEEEIKRVVLA